MKLRNILLSMSFAIATTAFGQSSTTTILTADKDNESTVENLTDNFAAVADTLLKASTADNIVISSTANATQITVRNINDTPDNFYYRTGNKKSNRSDDRTQINCSEINSIVVCETADCVNIEFKDRDGESFSYSFDFADPDNRSIKSYLGSKGSDFGFTISRGSTTKWEIITQGLAFGWATPLNASDMKISMSDSRDLMWNIVLGVRMTHKNHSLSAGLGIHHQVLATIGDHYYNKADDGRIEIKNFTAEQSHGESRLKFFSLQIPLIYKIQFGHKNNWGFNLGPILNFNTGGHIETKYKANGSEYKINTGKIAQRKVTVDGMAMINFQEIGIYARYSPMNRFNNRTGLDFQSLSTGIMLCF